MSQNIINGSFKAVHIYGGLFFKGGVMCGISNSIVNVFAIQINQSLIMFTKYYTISYYSYE